MVKRKIINIDEEKCTGCGVCVPNCPEGALQVVDGKARLVGELLCDGLGACIGNCPEDAIYIEEREAEDYDEAKVIINIVKQGTETLKAHLKHLKNHSQDDYLNTAIQYLKENKIEIPEYEELNPMPHACPGTMMRDMRSKKPAKTEEIPSHNLQSQLGQWPIQLHLLNPTAPYFQDADIVVAADCVPFTYADFHNRFLKDKILIIFCPKLDNSKDIYTEKLIQIFKNNNIKSITMVHMEVPCCFGTVSLVEEALKKSGKNILLKEYTISIRGEII